MLFSAKQAFVGREEIRAPLKTPPWEAIGIAKDIPSYGSQSKRAKIAIH